MASNRFLRSAPAAASSVAVFLAIAAGPPNAIAGPPDCRGGGHQSTGCTSTNGNQAPTISGTPSSQARVGDPYAFTPTASDPEGKTLSFSIANKPPWAAFSSTTGRLSGTPGTSAEGVHVDITIAVSDGKLTASLAPFSIVVSPANQAPIIDGTPPTVAREGQVYEFKPTAVDADGDPLTFTIGNRPAWATFDPQTGRLKGTPPTGSVGTYANISIRVSDGTLIVALPAFSITVEQASLGHATLSWVAPTTRVDGSPLTDLAGYRIRYGTSPGSYPNQLQIANPGITTCVIENLPPGTYYFVATAYDSSGSESGYSSVASKTIS